VKVLLTGSAGFIGFHVVRQLLQMGHEVVGLDNLNNYYDPALKRARLKELEAAQGFQFIHGDICDRDLLNSVFTKYCPERVVHLAAQAGVRYSIEDPYPYIESNIYGFLNVLEACRHNSTQHLIYASTSSVYGLSKQLPFSAKNCADHPVSFYGATKRANELMAHSYSSLFGLPTTGLRFFTVYGPWGRPDMALFIFTKKILAGEPIPLFSGGRHERDFTYVADIAEAVGRICEAPPAAPSELWNSAAPQTDISSAPYRVYNIGNNRSVPLMSYVEALERCLNIKAMKDLLPAQAGDIESTRADVDPLISSFAYRPSTPIEVGVDNFVRWYRDFYQV